VELFQVGAPFQITRADHRIRAARNFPAADVLAARGEAQFLGSARAKAQNPFSQPLRVKQLARLAVLAVRVAGIFRVEAMEGGFMFLSVARMEMVRHAESLAEARRRARRIRGY